MQHSTDVDNAIDNCYKDPSEFGLENDPSNSLDILKIELKNLIKEHKEAMQNANSDENMERKDEKESGNVSRLSENEDGDAKEADFYEEVEKEDSKKENLHGDAYGEDEGRDTKDSSENEIEHETLTEADNHEQDEKDKNEAELNNEDQEDQNTHDGYETRDPKDSAIGENKGDLVDDAREVGKLIKGEFKKISENEI